MQGIDAVHLRQHIFSYLVYVVSKLLKKIFRLNVSISAFY